MTDNENIKALLDKITFSVRCNSIYATVDIDLLKSIVNIVSRKQVEIERLQTEKDNLIRNYAECQVDNIKEFAERLKGTSFTHKNFGKLIFFEDIDNLVKEMVGDNNAE